MLLSLENDNLGALAVAYAGAAPRRCRADQSVAAQAGSENTAYAHGGSPGTWEALSPPRQNKPAGAGRSNPRPPGAVSAVRGSEAADAGVVPRSEGNRASGTGGSGHSTFIVPAKRGNRPEGSPRREGGCREAVRLVTPGGSMVRGGARRAAHRGRSASQQNLRGSAAGSAPMARGTGCGKTARPGL